MTNFLDIFPFYYQFGRNYAKIVHREVSFSAVLSANKNLHEKVLFTGRR